MSASAPDVARSARGGWACDAAFAAAFAVYLLLALALLASGLASVVVALSTPAAEAARGIAGGGGFPAELAAGVLDAAGRPQSIGTIALDYLLSGLNLTLGLLLVWLRPRDWTARLLAVGMVGTAAAFNLHSHGLFLAVAESPVNVGHFLAHAVSGLAYLHALLLFPDGHLPFRWGRRVLVGVYVLVAIEIAFIVLGGTQREGAGPLSVLALMAALPFQEIDIEGSAAALTLADIVAADASFFVLFFGLLVPLVGLAAQVYRYRTAPTAAQREQSRLLAWALTVALAGAVLFMLFALGAGIANATGATAAVAALESWLFRVFPLVFAVIPLALFGGLVRFRLWDIDRVLNRALVYTVLTGALALVYVLIVGVAGEVLRLASGQSSNDLALVVATAVVALLFQPARLRIKQAIDRRFHRRRYSAIRTLESFSLRLRDEVDLERLSDDVLDVVEETMQPAHSSLWLRGG